MLQLPNLHLVSERVLLYSSVARTTNSFYGSFSHNLLTKYVINA